MDNTKLLLECTLCTFKSQSPVSFYKHISKYKGDPGLRRETASILANYIKLESLIRVSVKNIIRYPIVVQHFEDRQNGVEIEPEPEPVNQKNPKGEYKCTTCPRTFPFRSSLGVHEGPCSRGTSGKRKYRRCKRALKNPMSRSAEKNVKSSTNGRKSPGHSSSSTASTPPSLKSKNSQMETGGFGNTVEAPDATQLSLSYFKFLTTVRTPESSSRTVPLADSNTAPSEKPNLAPFTLKKEFPVPFSGEFYQAAANLQQNLNCWAPSLAAPSAFDGLRLQRLFMKKEIEVVDLTGDSDEDETPKKTGNHEEKNKERTSGLKFPAQVIPEKFAWPAPCPVCGVVLLGIQNYEAHVDVHASENAHK